MSVMRVRRHGTRGICFILAAFMLCAVPAEAFAGERDVPETDDIRFDGYLVSLSVSPETLGADVKIEPVTESVYWVEDAYQLLRTRQTNGIEYIEPNYIVTLDDTQTEPPDLETDEGYSSPFSGVGAEFSDGYELSGRGVRIAVIDSGVDPDNINLQGVDLTGYDYVSRTETLGDELYHGTCVIQAVAGQGVAGGVTGIARDAEIVSLDCFSATGGGTVRVLVEAIRDAVDVYECDVINMSWGFKTSSEALYEALSYAASKGAILVAAAGNVTDQNPQGTTIYPAAFDIVIGVGAVDLELNVLESSQQTQAVDVSAPGVCYDFVNALGRLEANAGTSFAAPCVSAAAAILRQLVPQVEGSDAADLLKDRAVSVGDPGWGAAYGYGILNMDRLLRTPWSMMRSDAERLGQTILFCGWQLCDTGSVSIVTAYDEGGAMVAYSFIDCSGAVGSFCHEFKGSDSPVRYKVFYLNANFVVGYDCDGYFTKTKE